MRCLAVVLVLIALLSGTLGSAIAEDMPAIDPQAKEVLQRMSAFLAAQSSFTYHAESTKDILETNGEMIQYARGAEITIERPDRFAATVDGDLRSLRLLYNGDKVVLHDVARNFFAELTVPATLEKAIPYTLENFSIKAPFAQFIFPDAYDYLIRDVVKGSYLGIHRVNGIPCHHLAFRTPTIDWQLWVDAGDEPLPRKIIETEKRVAGGPQFTALLTDWKLGLDLDDSMFQFVKPEGAKQIDFLPTPKLTLPK